MTGGGDLGCRGSCSWGREGASGEEQEGQGECLPCGLQEAGRWPWWHKQVTQFLGRALGEEEESKGLAQCLVVLVRPHPALVPSRSWGVCFVYEPLESRMKRDSPATPTSIRRTAGHMLALAGPAFTYNPDPPSSPPGEMVHSGAEGKHVLVMYGFPSASGSSSGPGPACSLSRARRHWTFQ